MARLRVLELPAKVLGEYVEIPFALVIDRVEMEGQDAELNQDEADSIAGRVGAVAAILTACTLDVD